MTSNHRNKLIALICTLVFHVMLVVLLLSLYLRYNGVEDNERTWPPVDSAEVLFGGEYVMIGDRPELAQNTSEPAPAADGKKRLGDGIAFFVDISPGILPCNDPVTHMGEQLVGPPCRAAASQGSGQQVQIIPGGGKDYEHVAHEEYQRAAQIPGQYQNHHMGSGKDRLL